jgi:hypothetical protein
MVLWRRHIAYPGLEGPGFRTLASAINATIMPSPAGGQAFAPFAIGIQSTAMLPIGMTLVSSSMPGKW